MKTLLYIILITLVLSSCTDNKFLNRKYTAGFYSDSHKSLKHNTIKSVTEKIYASLNSNIELKKTNSISGDKTEKEIINAKINSIIKKDSIIHILKKGRDEIIVIKNNLPDVYVKINPLKNEKTITSKKPQLKSRINSRENIEKDLRIRTTVGLLFFFVPVMGFIIAIQTKKRIRKYQLQNLDVDYDSYRLLANLGLWLSVLPSLAVVLCALAIVLLIVALIVIP